MGTRFAPDTAEQEEEMIENDVPNDDTVGELPGDFEEAMARGGSDPSKLSGVFEALENFGMSSDRVEKLRRQIEDLGVREGVQKAAEYFADQLSEAREYARNNKEKVIGGAAGVLVGASLLAMAIRRASGGKRGAAGDTAAAARGGRNSKSGGRSKSRSSSKKASSSKSSSKSSRGGSSGKAGRSTSSSRATSTKKSTGGSKGATSRSVATPSRSTGGKKKSTKRGR
jgi:hypothetical protein